MHSYFITPDSPRWIEMLSRVTHDFYHFPEYFSLTASQEKGMPVAFVAEESDHFLFIPIIIRPVNLYNEINGIRLYDATSPYGYPGPLIYIKPFCEDDDFIKKAIYLFLEELRKKNIVSVFLRLHPILNFSAEPFNIVGCLLRHGETVSIDLKINNDEIWKQTRRTYRYDIKRAEMEGQIAYIDPYWEAFDDFFDIYQQTMRRVGASEFYFFNRDYFIELKKFLGERLHLCVVRINNQVASAGLFTEVCGIVQYHLSATNEVYLNKQPTKVMINFMRYWAKERDNKFFHLGGGLRGEKDSLFFFKAGFSKIRHPFFTWRIITNEDIYFSLVKKWESIYNIKADEIEGFFPAYRKNVPE